VHTSERSPCAAAPAAEVLRIAAKQELDGVVFTDHHALWERDDLDRLRERVAPDLVLLSGQEITFQGIDFLVFGWDGNVELFPTRQAFVEGVREEGGVVVVAHPFSILYYLQPEIMAGWGADGIEVFNALKGGPTPDERRQIRELGLAETAGSDFHRPVFPDRLGTCWTEIDGEVRDLDALMNAIRERRVRAVST
jgi:predicted metal-dependent phosphoesterase TrpH